MKISPNIYPLSTRISRLVIVLFFTLLFLAACTLKATTIFNPVQVDTALHAALEKFVRDRDGKVTRNALLLVDAPTVGYNFSGAAGIARVDTQQPLTPDRPFYVASVAKATTAVIIHQLAEQGAFGPKGIDTTLAELQVLPPEVLAKLALIDGVSYGESITLRQLLKQTSGLRDVFFDGIDNPVSLMPGTADGAHPASLVGLAAFDPQFGLSPLVKCTMQGVPAGCNPDDYLFRHKWKIWDYAAWQANPHDKLAGLLNFYLSGMNEHALWQPGKGFHYADTNYILLGLVIEKTTGDSLDHQLRTRIFDPLGMVDTYLLGADRQFAAARPLPQPIGLWPKPGPGTSLPSAAAWTSHSTGVAVGLSRPSPTCTSSPAPWQVAGSSKSQPPSKRCCPSRRISRGCTMPPA